MDTKITMLLETEYIAHGIGSFDSIFISSEDVRFSSDFVSSEGHFILYHITLL